MPGRDNESNQIFTIPEQDELSVQSIVHELFIGEPPGTCNANIQYTPQIQISDGIPLGSTISQKVKNKIWAIKLIEINILSPHYKSDPFSLFVTQKRFSIINNTGKNKTPLSTGKWTTAFLVFMDV